MKLIRFFAFAVCLSWVFSCTDDFSEIGTSVLPEGDKLYLSRDTFDVSSTTVSVDRVYCFTISEWLGSFSDPNFGSIKCDFMAQLYPASEMEFGGEKNIGDKLDSTVLRMRFATFMGDSLTPMQLSVYALNKQLPDIPYTDINPEEYYNPSDLLGRKFYTASDISVEDSIKSEDTYARTITLTLPQEFTEKLYRKFKEDPDLFKSKNKFNEFFPGIYVKNTYGNGVALDIRETSVRFYYKTLEDDTVVTKQYKDYLAVTPEVVNANHMIVTNPPYMATATNTDTDTTYVKTPAAFNTEITFPTQEIINKLKQDGLDNVTLNSLRFTVPVYTPEANDFSIAPPQYLLFIRSKDVQSFFAKRHMCDYTNTFYATYNATKHEYDFGNLNKFITNIISLNPDTTVVDEKISLIPISFNYITESYQTVSTNLYPSLGKLKKDLKVSILTVKK